MGKVMKLMGVIREWIGKKNYGIAPALSKEYDVNVTVSGLDHYDKDTAKSMRLDVLAGLRALSGVSWNEFGAEIDKEFLARRKK